FRRGLVAPSSHRGSESDSPRDATRRRRPRHRRRQFSGQALLVSWLLITLVCGVPLFYWFFVRNMHDSIGPVSFALAAVGCASVGFVALIGYALLFVLLPLSFITYVLSRQLQREYPDAMIV